MTQRIFSIKRKFTIVAILLLSITIFFSCADKKEYKMELTFQRAITANALHENDRILMRISKEIIDNGRKSRDATVHNHANNIIVERNASIGSYGKFVSLVDKILKSKNLEIISENGPIELLTYYQEKFNETHDSLIFQKLINMYLTFEKRMLNDDLTQVSGSCHWGRFLDTHISKTTDTVRVGDVYELAVIPETFDHNYSFVDDDCKIAVYKSGELVEMKYSVLKKGSVYLISLTPTQAGNYEIRGAFTQSTRLHAYVMQLKFTDGFVVNK